MPALAVKDWLTVVGLSSLIATIVGHWFSSAREHRRWRYENKRLEWRELIDRFHGILHNIRYFRSGSRKDILEDLNEGMLLLNNRLFIADTLDKWDVQKKWGRLIQDTMEPEKTFSPYEIISENGDFEAYLLDVARRDLKSGWGKLLHTEPEPIRFEKRSASEATAKNPSK